MITLHFEHSKSARYKDAVRLSMLFKASEGQDGAVTLTTDMKSVFERWEDFNSLFWIVVDWKGSYLEVDRMQYHSHKDKTRLFYALQLAHGYWINYVEQSILDAFDPRDGSFNQLKPISERDADRLIDMYLIHKDKF
jgi:hypothetical protein